MRDRTRDRTLRDSVTLTLITCRPIYCLVLHQPLTHSFTFTTDTNLYRFPFDKNFWFEIPKISRANGTQISGKEENLKRYTQIILTGISIPFASFPLGISGIFGWIVRISEIQQLSDFPEVFPGNFSYHLLPFRNIPNFWLNGKRLKFCFSEFFKNKSESPT